MFDQFTKLYALSKTLRFELKPIGKTRENMNKHLKFDKDLQTFMADQVIEDAYQTLKPVLDFLHERFINESLQLEECKNIDFSVYLEKYRNKKDLKDRDFEPLEKELRAKFAVFYEKVGEEWKKNAGLNEKGKSVFTEKSFKILTEKGVLTYISQNVHDFVDLVHAEKLEKALQVFERFYTYFTGFNLNRENYYETGKEADTAVASRIVHENLPKFCDNLIVFQSREQDYLGAYELLKGIGRSLVTQEGQPLTPITVDIFQLEFFNKCFSQTQIEEYNRLIGNANFVINLYNQAFRDNAGFSKLPLFKTLYKQIGCGEKKSLFFTVTHATKAEADKVRGEGKAAFSVEEVLYLAKQVGEKYFQGKSDDGLINTVPELLDYIEKRQDFKGVYWSKAAINTISGKYLANWYELKDKLKDAKVFVNNKKGSEEDVKIPDAVELEGLFMVLNKWPDWKTTLFKNSILEDAVKKNLVEMSVNASSALLALIFADINYHVKSFIDGAKGVPENTDYKKEEDKNLIKSWMDHALAVSQMLNYFSVRESKIKGVPSDSTIVEALNTILHGVIEVPGKAGVVYEKVDWFKWYDALRNYLTKKPQDDAKKNKLKLNFENGTLAGGWDLNKEPDNYCVILKNSSGAYLLAITSKKHNRIFEKELREGRGKNKVVVKNSLYEVGEGEAWEKMEYKLLPGPNKMLPKCLLPKSDRKKYGADEDVLVLYERGSFKKANPRFSLSDLHRLIDFYKDALKKYEDWRCFDFSFQPTEKYADISQFYSEVEKQGYKLDFVNINKTVIDQWVEEGKVYLFAINNQDFNQGKKINHRNNLHTIYWKTLFENVLNRPKLNGEAEIFYRKALSIVDLGKRKDKNGNEVVKNYRFSKEKFLFHVPITLNFCLKNEKVNKRVNENFADNQAIHFLGIDRGEKHLAYYCLVNQNGQIVKQGTLNMPFVDANGKPRLVKAEKKFMKDGKVYSEIVECKDYNELLEARAGNRDYARKNWQTIGTIKELKEGYISQVVRKIADLCIDKDHPAFIVLEDLNTGFKRGRQKIEKSVYQKLELALAKKLNFFLDKSAKPGDTGSVTNALQLTPPVNNYGDIENRKQVGIMLYTRANYTSQTDPKTGWRKSIYLKTGPEENIKKQIVESFSDISFDGKDYVFVYKDENTGRNWKLYSGINGRSLDRFRGKRGANNEWKIEQQNVVSILDGVFEKFAKDRSLLSQIVDEGKELTKVSGHTAWESLRFAIELIQQIRNTGVLERDADFLLSPVRDSEGRHFDSREFLDREQKGDKIDFPSCGDANGAYNIARKGLVMNEHIKRGYGLYVSDDEWDAWLMGATFWEEWIKKNEKSLKSIKEKKGA